MLSLEQVETINEIRRRLLVLAARPADAPRIAREVDDLLEQMVLKLPLRTASDRGNSMKGARYGRPKDYRVDQGLRGPVLLEFRKGSRYPFSVPRDFYNAMAAAMATTPAASFEDLHSMLGKQLGTEQPVYMARTVIRFWISRQLVCKLGRSKYDAADRQGFVRAATRAWESLASEGAVGGAASNGPVRRLGANGQGEVKP